jgi:hypothetical protein
VLPVCLPQAKKSKQQHCVFKLRLRETYFPLQMICKLGCSLQTQACFTGTGKQDKLLFILFYLLSETRGLVIVFAIFYTYFCDFVVLAT